jgi:outer membrane protein
MHMWPWGLGPASTRLAKVVSALILLGAVPASPWAQETETINLQQAIDTALKSNPSILQAKNRVAASRISVGQARAEFYPDLSASLSGSRNYSKSAAAGGGTGDYEGSDGVSARLSSNVSLFDGLSTINSLKKSNLDLAAGAQNYDHSRQELIFNTISDYLDVLMTGELVESQLNNLEAQRQQLSLTEEFYNAGNRSLADVLQQRATVAQAELQVLDAEHQESQAKLGLRGTMGLEPTADYRVEPVPHDSAMSAMPEGSLDNIVKDALTNRSDIAAEERLVQSASRQVAIARAGYWPSLSLGFNAGSNYSSSNEYSGFSDQMFEDNPSFGAGLSLSIPIFDRARTSSSVQQAKIALDNEKLALAGLRQQVIQEARQAVLDYEDAAKRLQVADAQLEYAAQAFEATNARYKVGASTLVEVTASNAQYVSARNERVRAVYTLILARIALGYHAGDIGQAVPMLGVTGAGRTE